MTEKNKILSCKCLFAGHDFMCEIFSLINECVYSALKFADAYGWPEVATHVERIQISLLQKDSLV